MTDPTDKNADVERVARAIALGAVNNADSWRNYTYAARAAIAALPQREVIGGIYAIAAERNRQVSDENWTPEHDNLHGCGEIAGAAACYAMKDLDIGDVRLGRNVKQIINDLWPWAKAWWKPKSHRENLVRAGALIAAEIDRIDRRALAGDKP